MDIHVAFGYTGVKMKIALSIKANKHESNPVKRSLLLS